MHLRALGTLLWTGGLLLLPAGCARSPAPPGPTSRAIVVEVNNQNFNDVRVYLVSRGQRVRVGQVGGLTRGLVTVPATLAPVDGRVILTAEVIGGSGSTTTPDLLVRPGQQVNWTIASDLAMSSASVR